MKYRYYLGLSALCFLAAAVMSWLHLDEENSPLVFGAAFLGLAALASPLILGARADPDAPVRPGGKAILQAFVFPIVGAGLLGWGILGAAGVVPPKSFDGLRQHCRACKTTWILDGERAGRPHYVDACESCLRFPALPGEVEGLLDELGARATPRATPSDPLDVAGVKVEVIGPVRFASSEVLYRLEACRGRAIRVERDGGGAVGLRVELEAGPAAAGGEREVRIRLALVDPATGEARASVERRKAFLAEIVRREAR